MAIKAYFDNIKNVLLETLQTAQKSIYAAVAWLTDKDIIRVLEQKAQEGVRVQVLITDDDNNKQIDFTILESAKGRIWRVKSPNEEQNTLMHNKFCVIDSHIVITGSYNWTKNAQRNFENITITDEEPVLASSFIAEFERIKHSFLGIEMPTSIDFQAIHQRIQILRHILILQDEEDINHQCIKLRKLLPKVLTTDLYTVEQIIQTIHNGQYKDALVLAEQYLHNNTHTVSVNFDAFNLSLHIKYLEKPLNPASIEVKEIKKIAQIFYKEYQQELDETIEHLFLKQQRQLDEQKTSDMTWWNNLDNIWKNIFFAHTCFWKNGIVLNDDFIRNYLGNRREQGGKSVLEIFKKYFENKENIISISIEDIRSMLNNLTIWHLSYMDDYTDDLLDYSVLEKINKITDLRLDRYDGVRPEHQQARNYSFLLNMKDLKHLSICNDFNNGFDAYYLSKSTKLESLNLSGTYLIKNKPYLSNLSNLEYLDVSETHIDDINFLKSLKNIRSLNMLENEITDFTPLLELKKLEDLDISMSRCLDFSFLKILTGLKVLNIFSNEIVDISFLSNLRNLTVLNIGHNKITDISFLSNLKNLTTLDIGGNEIVDISPLKILKKLKKLDISYNKIQEISLDFLESFPSLEELYLDDNPIQNIPQVIFETYENHLPKVKAYLEAKES